MQELLFENGAVWFTIPALLGTAVFAVRVVLMLAGGAGADFDVDSGGGLDDIHAGDAGDAGHAFEILSFQSLCAFMMGFGWGGLGALKGSEWGWTASILTGIAAGVGMVWLLALLLKGMHDLQSSGNVAIASALGAEGDVYVGIPGRGEGRGQVRLVLGNRERMYNAVSEADGGLPSRTRVRVTRVNDDNTVTVAPV